MRIGRAHGRLVIIDGDGVIDVATGSGGEFSADPDRVFAVWDRFTEWAGGYAGPGTHTGPLVPEELDAPAIPHTRTGKKLEIPVKRSLQGGDPRQVMDAGAVDNPDALRWFAGWHPEART